MQCCQAEHTHVYTHEPIWRAPGQIRHEQTQVLQVLPYRPRCRQHSIDSWSEVRQTVWTCVLRIPPVLWPFICDVIAATNIWLRWGLVHETRMSFWVVKTCGSAVVYILATRQACWLCKVGTQGSDDNRSHDMITWLQVTWHASNYVIAYTWWPYNLYISRYTSYR